MDRYTKINILIGISFLIGSFIVVTFNPNSDGLFIATLMALIAFINLMIARVKLKLKKFED